MEWRDEIWGRLHKDWDVIVIGGGVTGAGILAMAVRLGLTVLLVEKGDFGSGTSSRSSKLVHGGLRYLKNMQVQLTRESVMEREHLLSVAPGLVEPLGFIYPVYKSNNTNPWLIQLGLEIYTHLAPDVGKYRRLDKIDLGLMAPGLRAKDLERCFYYTDAQTDDARLVVRLLQDALSEAKGNALALNYCKVTGFLKQKERVNGVQIEDTMTGEKAEVHGKIIINATGVWADELRSKVGGDRRLRPLRGSHLYFKFERLPVYQAIAFSHPDDCRPVFVYPWEGVTLVGTTDVDHLFPLDDEPSISLEEADYLLRAVQYVFPELDLTREDVISTQAGVRPVISKGKKDPSAESRDHAVWNEHGLLTVTGGKLTTFRLIALDALRKAHKMDKRIPAPEDSLHVFERPEPSPSFLSELEPTLRRRLLGRYGKKAYEIFLLLRDFPSPIEETPYFWAEIIWSARNEAICHLDDLLLRRFRIGILLPDGGIGLIPQLKAQVQDSLGWNDEQWAKEVDRYEQILEVAHGLPPQWKKRVRS